MRLFTYFCIVLSSIFGCSLAQAQKVFYIAKDATSFKGLNKYLYTSSSLPFSFAITQANSLKSLHSFSLYKANPGTKQHNYIWGKIIIENKLPKEYNGVLFLGNRYINQADVYVISGNKTTHKRAGTHVRGSQKDINIDRNMPKVMLALKPGERKTFFIRFQNLNGKPISINLQVQKQSYWRGFIQERNLIQGLFQGAVGLILLYNLFLYLLSHDRVYLYYTAYLLFTGMYFFNFYGFVNELWLPEYPWLFYDVYLLSTVLIPIFYLQFIRVYLNSRQVMPRWDRIMVIWIFVRFAELGVMEVILHLGNDFNLVHNYHRQYALMEAGFFVVLAFVFLQTKVKTAIFLFAGVVILHIGLVISILKTSYYGNFYFQAGSLLEILCFSLGLGYRIKRNEKDKVEAQAEVIRIQEHANKYLEDKVKERTTQLEGLNGELTKKNNDLHASMRYAHKLQKGVLPFDTRVQQLLPEHFIFYQPRDIVSGDFYWVEEVDNKTIVVVADCTGHGIPGAMMSMLGSSALTDIILNKKIIEADIILNKLSKIIEFILRQDQSNIRDGMDIGVCIIDKDKRKLEFAGAHHALYYFQAGEMAVVKGSPISIGGFQQEKIFEKNTITLQNETVIYMCSDGYQDQFGGPKDKKFMKSRLRELLTSIHLLPMLRQKEILETTLQHWMQEGKSKQTDDILVLGARV